MTTSPRVPVLCAGDKLTRAEFERRYAAMPDLKKAELIEGIVYLGSLVPHVQHGRPHQVLSCWLGFYEEATPGLDSGSNATLRLDLDNELQPDLLLRMPEHAGGRSRITTDDYLEGPPELVIEVTASSVSYDLHQKLGAYRRNGVAEYLVYRVEDGEVDWFVLEGGVYVRQQPDADGTDAAGAGLRHSRQRFRARRQRVRRDVCAERRGAGQLRRGRSRAGCWSCQCLAHSGVGPAEGRAVLGRVDLATNVRASAGEMSDHRSCEGWVGTAKGVE